MTSTFRKYSRKLQIACNRRTCRKVFAVLLSFHLMCLGVVIIRMTMEYSNGLSTVVDSLNQIWNVNLTHMNKTRRDSVGQIGDSDDDDIAVLNITEAEQSPNCRKIFLTLYENYCKEWMVPKMSDDGEKDGRNKSATSCPCIPPKLEGNPGRVSQEGPPFDQLESMHQEVKYGGHWSPSASCIPRQHIALIIPFRDRESHLRIFLNRMIPLLQRQMIEFTIFVVEQVEQNMLFNKAILMNSGFKEIQLLKQQFDCFIFHDVDLLPEDDWNFYTCVGAPRHVGAYVDKWQYELLYPRIFGGATAFTKRQFEMANGFSNEFYGWGGEDDDMLNRVEAVNRTFVRYPKCVATYTMIRHEFDKNNPYKIENNVGFTVRPEDYYQQVGLRTVSYRLVRTEKRKLFTHLFISVPPPPTRKSHTSPGITSPMPFLDNSTSIA